MGALVPKLVERGILSGDDAREVYAQSASSRLPSPFVDLVKKSAEGSTLKAALQA